MSLDVRYSPRETSSSTDISLLILFLMASSSSSIRKDRPRSFLISMKRLQILSKTSSQETPYVTCA